MRAAGLVRLLRNWSAGAGRVNPAAFPESIDEMSRKQPVFLHDHFYKKIYITLNKRNSPWEDQDTFAKGPATVQSTKKSSIQG